MGTSTDRADRSPSEGDRAVHEVGALVEAAIAVLGRQGDGLTVADVLEQAGLSTRAFYRHFASKDELVVAVYEHESRRSVARRRERLAACPSPRAALGAWVDEVLTLGFDRRRARRTVVLWQEAIRLRRELRAELAAIRAAEIEPLVEVLAAGLADGSFPAARPAVDAASIHAVTWAVVEARLVGRTRPPADRLEHARDHVLRFCLPALGASP